jgi:hypothetical protein
MKTYHLLVQNTRIFERLPQVRSPSIAEAVEKFVEVALGLEEIGELAQIQVLQHSFQMFHNYQIGQDKA